MAFVTEFDLHEGKMESENEGQAKLGNNTLEHSKFVILCAQTKLDRSYQPHDPDCEGCLANAVLPGRRSLSARGRILCCDTFVDPSAAVPREDAARLARLKAALDECQRTDKTKDPAYRRRVVREHGEENIQYFMERQLSRSDAEGCVWALSFYTGEHSNTASRGGSMMLRRGNMKDIEKDSEQVQEFLRKVEMPLYYLVLALKHIPYYWGYVTRYINMKPHEQQYYQSGNIVTWIQFSSSRRGKEGAASFMERNTKIVVWSQKGRHIDAFSNFSTKHYHAGEDEVLFLPFTRLLVLKVEKQVHGEADGIKTVVHCRELELGLTHGKPLLWVDDMIHKDTFEMKQHMEDAQLACQQEVKFVLKPSTHLALAFLASPFGQFHLNNPTNLRIITDMSRPEEKNGASAGAYLVKEVEKRFRGPIMVFTSNANVGLQKLLDIGVERPILIVRGAEETDLPLVYVTVCPVAAARFCKFAV